MENKFKKEPNKWVDFAVAAVGAVMVVAGFCIVMLAGAGLGY